MISTGAIVSGYEHRAGEAGITEANIRRLIPAFYVKVRRDPVLGPVFDDVIGDDWEVHVERVCSFWLYVTRLDRRYNSRNFMPAHIRHATIRADLIPRWLAIFRETAQELCPAARSEVLIDIAHRMTTSLEISLNRRDGEAENPSPPSADVMRSCQD